MERLDALLAARSARHALVIEPLAPIDLGQISAASRVDLVVVVGIKNPLDPTSVRKVLDQCRAVDTPAVFLGWGEWLTAVYEGSSSYRVCTGALSYCESRHWVEQPTGLLAKHVGAANSGRLLSGHVEEDVPSWLTPLADLTPGDSFRPCGDRA